MSFLNPAAFYLIGTIPLVLALHFLRLRRQSFVVPSMMLWHASPEDQKANVPFQRLRNWLLPLLQGFFLLVIIFSIARPALHIPGIFHGKIVFIVDNSASMLSKEMGATRLEFAKQEVIKHISQVSASGGMMVMTTNTSTDHIQQTFTTDKDKLKSIIKNISASHAARDLTSVFDLVAQYIDSEMDQVYYVSDFFEDLPPTSIPFHRIAVGETSKNIGIVQLSVERFADQFHILSRIKNWTQTEREITTQLSLVGGGSIDEKRISLPADKERSVLFSINADRLEGKAVSLQLTDANDAFDLDNIVWTILKPKRHFQILHVSNRELPFLTNLLKSYGEYVVLQTITPNEFNGSGDADLIIVDGDILSTDLNLDSFDVAGTIYINWQGELPFTEERAFEIVESPISVITTNKTHPIMQNVSLDGLNIKRSLKRELPFWGESLIESDRSALIWVGKQASSQYLVFEFDAFNPEISNFPFTIPDFPIMIYRCLNWFESNTEPIRSLKYQQHSIGKFFKTGETLMIEIPNRENGIVKVQKPDRDEIVLEENVFTETDQIGIYSVFIDDLLYERFAVNLLDENESTLSVSTLDLMTNDLVDGKEFLQPIMREVWQWVALVAVCLLLCEWWFYHRS